jgi:hypothetical protein
VSRRFWVVLLVILLLVVVLPGLAVLGWLASKQFALSRPVASPSSVERPGPAAAGAHTEEEVLDLPFWKQRPSRAELDATVERLLAPDGPAELAVGDNGKAWAPGAADGKGEGRHVLVHRPKEGGRPAVLAEMYDRMTAVAKQEEYKKRFEEHNKKQ